MDLQQLISQMGGLGPIAAQLGISESQAESGIGALLPAILGGFQKSAQGSGAGDLGSLASVIQGAGGADLIDNVQGSAPTDLAAGNGILGQIFGSKDVSRTVVDQAVGQSGLDAGTLKKLLPIVAMLVAGYMARSAGTSQGGAAGGGLTDILGSVFGGQGSGGLGGMLGSTLGGKTSGGLGALGSLLDRNGDGNPLDDILGMATKLSGR
ncbi:MAG: DUF937 domain-containing protein [Altererythrobacter sp.]|nr:DUF937 domain-containing protein [Altererythrobacter sp.]